MDAWPRHPLVYEVNTWVRLGELSHQAGRPLTLAEIPQAELEHWAELGFDGVWLMGVWSRSPAAREVARHHPDLQPGYHRALDDFQPTDVQASPYAIQDYRVDPALGGDGALAQLRQRLCQVGLRLILDFVPNHLALDHAWVTNHPHWLVQASGDARQSHPQRYFQAGGHWLAHGRDPYFPPWTDTVQVDYRRPGARRAMADTLLSVAERCDGVRCDMAMLVNRGIFTRTWGGAFDPPWAEFWPAVITDLRAHFPDFLLMAEVYWDLEWDLQQMGFDYCYDKRLYDRLRNGSPWPVRLHLQAHRDYQSRLVRFLENHDEERALEAFGPDRGRACAVLTLTLPGLRLIHEGQRRGWRRKLPVQLSRRQWEPSEPGLEGFYHRLLTTLAEPVFHQGDWRLLESRPAGPDNHSHSAILAHAWRLEGERRLAVVNLSGHWSQCRLPLGFLAPQGRIWRLDDLLDPGHGYQRDGDRLATPGLYLDLPPFGHHLFSLIP